MSETPNDTILRVAAETSARDTAAAIAHAIYDHGVARLRAVGAGAVNQSVKAIAIASGYTAPRGISLVCVPGFTTIEGEGGKSVSAITFKVMSV